MKQRNLTPKQEKFCHAYLATSNATTAYKEAYSTKNMKLKTITERASRLLREYNVSTMLVQLRDKASDKVEIKLENILRMVLDTAENGEQENNRLKATDMLLKHLGAYTERIELNAVQKVEFYAPKKDKLL